MQQEAELDIVEVVFVINYDDAMYDKWQKHLKALTEAWVIKYLPFLKKTCIKACMQYNLHNVADDLVNDCVIEAYRYVKNYRPMSGISFNSFLVSYFKLYPSRHDVIARYTKGRAIGTVRSSKDSNTSETLEGIPAREEIFTSDEYRSASELLASLPELDRTYLLLKYVSGLKNTEIARAIGTNEGTVRYQLKRILGIIKVRGDGQ